MTNLGTVGFLGQSNIPEVQFWRGATLSTYKYWVHPLGTPFNALPGNYIFAKWTGSSWIPIYIGQTNDLSERFDNHHKAVCIQLRGATHIHVHTSNELESIRLNEESDLLAGCPTAKVPVGCNG